MKHLSKHDYTVKPVAFTPARTFVCKYHYSKSAANTATVIHGLFHKDELVGVALWMPPTKGCAQSVAGDDWKQVLSLSRLAIHPDVPTNGASFLIGRSIRLIKQEGRWKHLVTYADTGEGHEGTIYKATNWTYVGCTAPYPRWVNSEGKHVARKATKSRTFEDMESLGYKIVGRYRKHKYVMHL